jgi:hypothetical protein
LTFRIPFSFNSTCAINRCQQKWGTVISRRMHFILCVIILFPTFTERLGVRKRVVEMLLWLSNDVCEETPSIPLLWEMQDCSIIN